MSTLETSFRRITFAARGKPERLTCDLGVRLAHGRSVVALQPGLVLVETKSEHGRSPADKLLEELEIAPISLSKYRVGIGLLGPRRLSGPQPGSDLFA